MRSMPSAFRFLPKIFGEWVFRFQLTGASATLSEQLRDTDKALEAGHA